MSSSLLFFPFCLLPPKQKLHFYGVSWHAGQHRNRRDVVQPCCSAESKSRSSQGLGASQRYNNVVHYQGPRDNNVEDHVFEVETVSNKISISKEIKERVDEIKSMLESMEDGEISISAYDTAWVALIRERSSDDQDGSNIGGVSMARPQFPSSLHWIVENQLPDGSWGDPHFFSAHDRIISTLSCIVALKSWNIHPKKCDRGTLFIKENLSKLEDEKTEHMPIGFEVVFPSVLAMARKLGIEVPEDSSVLRDIHDKRDLKLSRIPKEVMHKVPTVLLYSLEGMEGMNWKDLFKWQSPDGSFLFSPSSTAFALMQTQDPNCFNYLRKAVDRFNGGVPSVYPVDLFEHIWVVDRLQRLGICRYFKEEIKKCMAYVFRYWTEQGICWARNSWISDLDDTAMGFRLLRLHGHQVSADVFEHFKNGSEFCTFKGQLSEAVTGMFNLYRASQMQFPGEKILEDAKRHSVRFLREKRAANQLHDKWIITKDLPGEVGYALDVPWCASLPRVEARFYIDHYGGHNDVWIGKTLYRMHYVNNNKYLELAKLDYNNCQALHISEWNCIQRWYSQSEIGDDFGISKEALVLAYFVASSSIYEPERSKERIVWTKTSILVDTIASFFGTETTSIPRRRAFVCEYKTTARAWIPNKLPQGVIIRTLLDTLNQLSLDMVVVHGRDIYSPLRDAWEKWLVRWEVDGDKYSGVAELLVQSINLAGGRCMSEEWISRQPYQCLSELSDRICCHLGRQITFFLSKQINYQAQEINGDCSLEEAESAMQELVELVFCDSADGIDTQVNQTFLTIVKSFYYIAFCDTRTVNFHISKVLFERVK